MPMSHRVKRKTAAAGAFFLLATAGLAHGKDDTLELLARKGVITAEEYATLKTSQKDRAEVSLKDGLRITGNDGSSLRIGTLIQADAAYFDREQREAPNGTEIRRARLSFGGTTGVWNFRLEGEFAGTATLTDGFAAWNGPVTITGGHFKMPYSLESLMSDKDLAFMERSLSSAFLASRAPGLMISDGNAQGGWAIGLFGEPLHTTGTAPTASSSTATANADDEGGGLSVRMSHAFFADGGNLLHVAGSAHYRVPTQGGSNTLETLRLSSRPEANQFTDRLLNTGNITGDVGSYQLSALELASSIGSLLMQAEYTQATVTREANGFADANFSGGYVQASYTLTGEKRAYKADKGVFEGVVPKGKVAWEMAVRASQMDLNDAGITGGKETNGSFAVNAYIGSAMKLSFNYVQVLETADIGPAALVPGEKPSAVMLRGQLAY